MTITVNDTRDEYTATAGQTVFTYTFKIFEDTDLLVYQTADGVTPDDSTDLITAYTVTGAGNSAGGTIVLTSGATLNDKITIVSAIPESRTTDYQYNADFSADVVNDDIDRVVSLVKQISNTVERMPQYENSVQGVTGISFQAPTSDGYLQYNAAGDAIISGPIMTSNAGTAQSNYYTDSGSANAYVLTAATGTIAPDAYFVGMEVVFNPANDNTGASTVNVNGLGVKDIKYSFVSGGALSAGDIKKSTAGSRASLTHLVYNGTYFTPKHTITILPSNGAVFFGSYSSINSSTFTMGSSTGSITSYASNLSTTPLYTVSGYSPTQGNSWVRDTYASFDSLKMQGSTSGSVTQVWYQDKTSGYAATINATSVQQKVYEWDTVALKATKAFELPTYANLAAINAAITSPRTGMLVYVTGQGMAIYIASWVKTTDESTAIT